MIRSSLLPAVERMEILFSVSLKEKGGGASGSANHIGAAEMAEKRPGDASPGRRPIIIERRQNEKISDSL